MNSTALSESEILKILGRDKNLFFDDLIRHEEVISGMVSRSSFLIIGGAGSIGQSVAKEIFLRNPKILHVVDISENELVELVRDIRSSFGYIKGDFLTFAIDCGSKEFEMLMLRYKYDYVLNLSALKHVRSEKDPFTLMRLIETNILNTVKTIELSIKTEVKNYFCVSTDKATNPVNMMGASKKIMELFLLNYIGKINISSARFANVAFSNGSLLNGFLNRLNKKQPLSAPFDIERYFITQKESGILCLFSALFGLNGDIFFPKLNKNLSLIKFSDIASELLSYYGYKPYLCQNEEQARSDFGVKIAQGDWPCFFFETDTSGEKFEEEFFTKDEFLELNNFLDIGIIKNTKEADDGKLNAFMNKLTKIRNSNRISQEDFIDLFTFLLPDFKHLNKEKNLDQKM
jgi:FlaA1/EpsC-like NDP-sugar epimerase